MALLIIPVLKWWSRARGPYGYLRTWNWPITAREISQPCNNKYYKSVLNDKFRAWAACGFVSNRINSWSRGRLGTAIGITFQTRTQGGGCTGCTCTSPPPHLGKKFRSEMSKRGEKVPPRYVGKKECAHSAQIPQNNSGMAELVRGRTNFELGHIFFRIQNKTVNFLEPKVYTIKRRPLLKGK